MVAARTTARLTISPELLPRAYDNQEIRRANLEVGVRDPAGGSGYSQRRPVYLHSASDLFWGKRFSNAQFIESLNMASESGTDYSGVLCGRATWKEGIPVYATKGVRALEDWLSDEGVKNINAVNEAIRSAKPWHAKVAATA